MSPFTPRPFPYGQAGRIDALCDQFEAEWIAGGRPRLEEMLPRAEERDRAALVAELLGLELENRLRRGEQVSPEEYHQRLPGYTQVIDEVFTGLRGALRAPAERAISSPGAQAGATADPGQRYRIESLLGQGGMGAVYRAHDRVLGRTVALKVIRPDALTPNLRARFAAEARAVARLDHPHIIKVFDVGEMPAPDGSGLAPYLTLEYVPGGSLGKRLCGALEPAVAARLVGLLARAIQHAHERGIAHRDLKLDNVLLAESSDVEALNTPLGRPQITDFGLAREMGSEQRLTHGMVPLGTPGYLAPEQAEGGPDVGPAADVHALGVILYRLLSGRMPFESSSLVGLLHKIRCQPPVPLRQVCSSLPAELERLCLACLDKEPESRPAVGELAEQLEKFCREDHPKRIPRKRSVWQRSRRACLLAGLSVAAVLAVVVWLRWPFGASPREPSDPLQMAEVSEQPKVLPAEKPPEPSKPLRVKKLDVERITKEKVGANGVLGEHVFEARVGDEVCLRATLSRPGYAWLLSYGTNGSEKLCYPECKKEAPARTDKPCLPSANGTRVWTLNEGAGWQVFAVVASSQPLPSYEDWFAKRGPALWARHPAYGPGFVWLKDEGPIWGRTPDGTVGQERGPAKMDPGRAGLVELTRWLRRQEGVEAVFAVGFTVLERE
jgi:serine/threonine protein kinase